MVGMAMGGAAFSLTAGVLLYVASSNQRLLGAPWPARLKWAPGFAAALAALLCLRTFMGSGASVFIVATALMLVLTFLPFIATFMLGNRTGK